MRIFIKEAGGRRFSIPCPLALATFGINLGGFGVRIARRYVDKEIAQYMDSIDFRALALSFNELKRYKGLKIVEVKSGTGEEVTIII